MVELIEESLMAALNYEKPEWIECRKCGTKTPVVIPNIETRVRAATALLSELEGKVGTHREPPTASAAVGDLTDLSDDDLLALLNMESDNDGETDSSGEEEATG